MEPKQARLIPDHKQIKSEKKFVKSHFHLDFLMRKGNLSGSDLIAMWSSSFRESKSGASVQEDGD